jgi:hypothetical protein
MSQYCTVCKTLWDEHPERECRQPTNTPDALRLADALESDLMRIRPHSTGKEAAAELRRLHAEVERLRQAQGGEADKWEGGEGWESLAWELCADECGEDACNELIWEGGPIPEPWGDRWMKYEGEAKRLIALVRKHTSPPLQADACKVPQGWKLVPVEPTLAMHKAYRDVIGMGSELDAAMVWRAMLREVLNPPLPWDGNAKHSTGVSCGSAAPTQEQK